MNSAVDAPFFEFLTVSGSINAFGSARNGLRYAAARTLIEEGHEVVLHARSHDRAGAIEDLTPQSAGVVIGDLSSSVETQKVAEQVNAIGRMDEVIYNAGVYRISSRSATPEATRELLRLAPWRHTC